MLATSLPQDPTDHVSREYPIAWTLDKTICWSLVVAVVFLAGADFRGDTGEQFSVHWQIYMRLLIALLCGIVGFLLLFPRTYRDFFEWPGLLLTAHCAWYGLILVASINFTYSAAAWVSLLGTALFIPGAMRVLGGFHFLKALGTGLILYLVGSWIAYLLFPEIGIFKEQVTQTDVIERMGGLGHPNELGFYSAFATIVFAGLSKSRRISPWILMLAIALGVATMFVCFSRTAILVCVLGLLVTCQTQVMRRANLVAIGLAMILGLSIAFIALGTGRLDWALDSASKKLTKSGDAKELATATGRTEIWSYAIKQIAASPAIGYGYCTARFVMEDHSYHCHNVVLNALMYGGFPAGLIVATIVLYFIYGMLFVPRPEIDGLAICIVAGGMVEGLFSAPSPAASMTIWISILFWRQLKMRITQDSLSE